MTSCGKRPCHSLWEAEDTCGLGSPWSRLPLGLLAPNHGLEKKGIMTVGNTGGYPQSVRAWGYFPTSGRAWGKRDYFTEVLILTSVPICSLLFFRMHTQSKYNRLGSSVRTEALEGIRKPALTGPVPWPTRVPSPRCLAARGSRQTRTL